MSRLGTGSARRADDDPQSDGSLKGDIERLSAIRTRDLSLPPAVMAAYLSASWSSRRKLNVSWMAWAAAVNAACALIAPFSLPAEALAGVIAGRLAVMAALLVGALVIWRSPRPGLEGVVTILAALGAVAGASLMAAHAGPLQAERYLIEAIFLCGTAVAVSSIPWRDTLILAGLVTLALAGAFWRLASETLTGGGAAELAAFYAAGLFGLVLARRSMNKVLYRVFVLGVNDRLKMEMIERANDTLHAIARTDPLTQVANRRHFDETFEALKLAKHARVALFMIDIDRFKGLNDALGHETGDECLRAIAGIIRSQIRSGRDFLARFGGEEFVVVLSGIDPDKALLIAERVRREIEARGMPNPAAPGGKVTASVGVAASPPATIEQLLGRADAALYEAKSSGRNAVRSAIGATLRVV